MKRISLVFLFITVLAAVSFSIQPAAIAQATEASAAVKSTVSVSSPQLLVYYFHGDRRCKTCNAIEANTKAVLDSVFAEQLANGTIQWHVKNTDKEENEHFEKDYELLFGSVVAVKLNDGKQVEWKNLQKVWELVWDKDDFNKYIETELKSYLAN